MLTSEMVEAQSGTIPIEDFGYDAVLEMVRYLVCGKCHFTEVPTQSSLSQSILPPSLSSQENMLQILGLSLKYFLEALAQLADSFLEKQLSLENVFVIALEVNRISATKSRETTIEYFLRHWRRLARSSSLLSSSFLPPLPPSTVGLL
jgi:hypothetical protein